MKVSFNLNVKRTAVVLIALAVGWYLWTGVIEKQAEVPVGPLLAFGLFSLYLGSLFSGWLVERGLLYHFRCRGFNDKACRESVKEIETSLRRMPAKHLFG